TDILTMARLENGKFQVTPVSVDLVRAVEEVVGMMEPLAAEAGVALHHDSTPGEPADADPTSLRQILFNVLSNAIKFTPAGGRVEVRRACSGGMASVTVSDSGVGIPPDKISTVVLPFEQVEDAMARTNGGIGLGLSIVKSLVELHRGTLSIESEPGRG